MGPPKKTTFPAEFCNKYYTKDNHIQAEILHKKIVFENGGQLTKF